MINGSLFNFFLLLFLFNGYFSDLFTLLKFRVSLAWVTASWSMLFYSNFLFLGWWTSKRWNWKMNWTWAWAHYFTTLDVLCLSPTSEYSLIIYFSIKIEYITMSLVFSSFECSLRRRRCEHRTLIQAINSYLSLIFWFQEDGYGQQLGNHMSESKKKKKLLEWKFWLLIRIDYPNMWMVIDRVKDVTFSSNSWSSCTWEILRLPRSYSLSL